jgi:hypothetical protein
LDQNDLLADSEPARYIQKHAIELDDLTNLPEEILQFLAQHKIILMGEIHGINETPEMTLGLIKLLTQMKKPLILAIEVWNSQQNVFESFMKTGDVDQLKNSLFFKNLPQYGIGSLAMVNLLQQVRNLPNVEVFCFDPFSAESIHSDQEASLSSSQERDLQMARNLIKKSEENKNAAMLVLTGSLHASTEINVLLGTEYRPLGYWLSHLENSSISSKDVFSMVLKFEKGSSWGGFSEDGEKISFGVHEFTPTCEAYSQAVAWEKYFLMLKQKEEGYHAIFFSRQITPSYPLN